MLLRRLYLSRLAREDPQRIYHQQKSREYWERRNRLQRAEFWIGKNLYETRRWARSRRESASIFAHIFSTIDTP